MAFNKQLLMEMLRESMVYLTQHGSRTRQEMIDHITEVFFSDVEHIELDKNGRPDFETRFLWSTVGMVKAGWLEKSGTGVWTITAAGIAALDEYPDSESFFVAQDTAYNEWDAERKNAQQRAWLVRGSSVLGANLVPEWLAGGWCSLAASQLPPIEPDVIRDDLVALAEAAYDHLKHQERTAKVTEIAEFVIRMKAGDVVLTTSDLGVFVGDLGEGWEYVPSDEGRSNLRRPVAWRNADAGVDFSLLPATLQAKLKTGATVADLTGELTSIDTLTSEIDLADEQPSVLPVERQRDQRFDYLPANAAGELLVGQQWLRDFVDLLNDSRQVVLYGPPGTGKTYLARKIAEHLAGGERTRLVQFHPSYTYEDFFEGYRPTGDTDTGVTLELRPGPLRRLATEAKDHPERAFVMIIDELNRANIAKVFGELYFLLEYRDDAVELMYGGEPFTLPKNLYFIATMNTADRSIALLDAAMRRRFTFLELHPATEPTSVMLATWLAQRELPGTAATFLSSINAQIDDHDAHIGPSYFMTSDQSTKRMRRIFATQIEPLLRETYYDRWSTVGSRFDFDRLWSAAGGGSDHFDADNDPVFVPVELPPPALGDSIVTGLAAEAGGAAS